MHRIEDVHIRRVLLVVLLALSTAGPLAGTGTADALAQSEVITPDGRAYDAYVPAATKAGQFYQYTCEFDASWVILKTFGYDVPFEEQLTIVGHDQSVEPWYEETAEGFVIHGGDVTKAFSGDYTSNMLARTTGAAMLPLFEAYDLEAEPVTNREEIAAALDAGALIWLKATVDFQPWAATTWITPSGKALPTVLGNDHAVVAMGYNDAVVVIRDVLGPTDTNWNRAYEYDVPWETFLGVFEAQGSDGVAVYPPEAAPPGNVIEPANTIEPTNSIEPAAIQPAGADTICCAIG